MRLVAMPTPVLGALNRVLLTVDDAASVIQHI
jgi:hypothetical protein